MLQQTQVDRVLPYYARVPGAISNGRGPRELRDVRRHPHSVPDSAQPASRESAARSTARWSTSSAARSPDDPADLKKLPGIGTYTAGAIAAFAHERDVAFLDTNMRRVVSRVILGSESARESDAIEAASALVPPGHGWTWRPGTDRVGGATVHGPPDPGVHHLSAA